jgi:hypothetical protein
VPLCCSLFHHIRAVSTITDAIPAQCENHSQILGAKAVPAFRGGQLSKEPFNLLFENQKEEETDALHFPK